jgi:hypothetical protein
LDVPLSLDGGIEPVMVLILSIKIPNDQTNRPDAVSMERQVPANSQRQTPKRTAMKALSRQKSQ